MFEVSRHWFLRLILAGMMAIAFAGMAPAASIRVFSGSSPVFAPVFVADQQGFFKQEGLDVTVRPFTSGADATEGFRSGAAEFLASARDPPALPGRQ